MKELDAELELPTEEDENVGDVPKKKLKRKKSKEERAAERKIIFWTFLIIFGATLFFWLWPKIKKINFGIPSFNQQNSEDERPRREWKNYIEYKL